MRNRKHTNIQTYNTAPLVPCRDLHAEPKPEEEEANIVGHDGHVDMLQAAGSTHVGVRQPRPELASKTETIGRQCARPNSSRCHGPLHLTPSGDMNPVFLPARLPP